MPKRPKMSSRRPWRSSRRMSLCASSMRSFSSPARRSPRALAAYDLLLRNEDVLKDREFLFKLALFFAQNGRDGQAVELIERSCRLHPSGRYFFLGALQAGSGRTPSPWRVSGSLSRSTRKT
ncbi:MAG: tetratricopeptide repeat protein [Ignavibacteriales bacterium]|nr:tetratricopeptide repeat protein [Ignavibacteriales bacterium]